MTPSRHARALSLAMALIACLSAGVAGADGWVLRDGRFPGPSTVLRLTPAQVAEIERSVACRIDNTRTPYTFRLTPSQSRRLAALTGIRARRFAVFDSTIGDTGIELPANVVLRYAHDRIEVPHALLISDAELLQYEREVIGWNPAPATCTEPQGAPRPITR